jgi:hypothetical protein
MLSHANDRSKSNSVSDMSLSSTLSSNQATNMGKTTEQPTIIYTAPKELQAALQDVHHIFGEGGSLNASCFHTIQRERAAKTSPLPSANTFGSNSPASIKVDVTVEPEDGDTTTDDDDDEGGPFDHFTNSDTGRSLQHLTNALHPFYKDPAPDITTKVTPTKKAATTTDTTATTLPVKAITDDWSFTDDE